MNAIEAKQISRLVTGATNERVAVVFLHHFGGSTETWTEVIARLSHTEPTLRCLAAHTRGLGTTEAAQDDRGYTVANYADDLMSFFKVHQVQRCLLVGHSMGGKIALSLASRNLSAVAGLLLVASSPPTAEPSSKADREQLRIARGNVAVASAMIEKMCATRPSAEICSRTLFDMENNVPAAWNAWIDHGCQENISTDVTRINVPVTVLSGDQDSVFPPSLLRQEIVGRIRGSKLVVIPKSGHLMPLDAPAAIAEYVRQMVKLLDASPADSSLQPAARAHYPAGTVERLLTTDLVTEATRTILTQRIKVPRVERPAYFERDCFEILRTVCARLVPGSEHVDIAGEIDTRLAAGDGNGWRYAALPPDGDAYRHGLQGIDQTAVALYGGDFCSRRPADQDQVLHLVQRGLVAGGLWNHLDSTRFFEELLSDVSEIYYSEPAAQDSIGYVGMADNKGWSLIALNQLMPHEPLETEARHD